MWYYTIPAWLSKDAKHVIDVFDHVKLDPPHREAALKQVDSMSQEEFEKHFGIRDPKGVWRLNLPPNKRKTAETELVELKNALGSAFRTFVEGRSGIWQKGALVRCMNKVRHGLLVMKVQD